MLERLITAHSSLSALHSQEEWIDRISDLGISIPSSPTAPSDRRMFLQTATLAACATVCLGARRARGLAALPAAGDDDRFRVEARFYEKLPGKNVRCHLCPRG